MALDQHRGVVVAKNGMVATSQPLAVSAGLNVLQQGGNFADAAIATSAVLCVVEPYASHIGGDAFIIIYEARTGQTTAINASGAAPKAASTDKFPDGIPLRGMSAASVPGLVDAWAELNNRWGTQPLADLLEPAIDYAAHGFPAGYRYSDRFAGGREIFDQFPDTAQALLTDGKYPYIGSIVRQADLAWTLKQIADGGADAFYRGPITERIIKYSQENGGLFSLEDFEAHNSQISEPIKTNYRGYTVHGQPPVSQGHILLQELNLVEGFDLKGLGHNSADTIHLMVEAKKLAFADRAAFLGDPNFVDVPMKTLLSKEYADSRRQLIQRNSASKLAQAGEIEHDTTYFCIADEHGNAISFIQSVFWGFGSGAVAAGTGVLFNNRMTGFSLDPKSPNCLAPGKRTAHTLNAYLITKEHSESRSRKPSLAYVGGTPGGDVQVQSNLQVICNLIDYSMNPQEAIEAPRWQHVYSDPSSSGGEPDEPSAGILAIEDRIDTATCEDLTRRGHTVETIGPWSHGSAYQLIAVHSETGAYMAGSDPRVDGHAAGY